MCFWRTISRITFSLLSPWAGAKIIKIAGLLACNELDRNYSYLLLKSKLVSALLKISHSITDCFLLGCPGYTSSGS